MAALAGTTVTSAKLKAYNTWSYSCTAKPVVGAQGDGAVGGGVDDDVSGAGV